MADWFLIIVTIITFLILIAVAIYLLVYFQHPDDKNDAYFPKFVVVFGIVLAGGTIMLLPLDVSNNEGYTGCTGYDTKLCGGLDMVLFWNIMYGLILATLVVLIPFSIFYYEADDGTLMKGTSVKQKLNSRICEALWYTVAVIIIVGAIVTGLYFGLRQTNIPVREYVGTSIEDAPTYTYPYQDDGKFHITYMANMTVAGDGVNMRANNKGKNEDMQSIKLNVNAMTFFICLLGFVGWFFFALFGGIGIASLPLDLILAYRNRPRHMDAVEFADAQKSLQDRVNALVDVGELVKLEREENALNSTKSSKAFLCFPSLPTRNERSRRKEEREVYLQFKQAVFLLEKDTQDFLDCSTNYKNYNPLIPYVKLFLGILSVIISILWVLQTILFVLPKQPFHPFLNSYVQWFDSWFPLFGVLTVAVFSFYLLICAIKGCFKFGLRFFCFQLYPMAINKTYMSSFLFNISLILLCVIPVIQFTAAAFGDYARYTNISQIFGVQIQYLKFFQYFWVNKVFEYAWLVIAFLTSIYLACRPTDVSMNSVDLRDRLKNRNA